MKQKDLEFMKIAIEESKANRSNHYQDGGPFGAVIVKDGKVIASSHNTVMESKDPTAHAEINVIRLASQILQTNDLSGCTLYTSTEPCPMCLSAIIWANIKEVYYVNTKEDAEEIGFRDNAIYEYIKGNQQNILKKIQIEDSEALEVFKEYNQTLDKKTY